MNNDLDKSESDDARESIAISATKLSFDVPMVVSEIADNCMYTGLFGNLDSSRMRDITNSILESMTINQFKYVILDLSNVVVIDSFVVAQLFDLVSTIKLLGIQPIFCGITSIMAKAMVKSNIKFEVDNIERDLKAALHRYYELDGYQVVKV